MKLQVNLTHLGASDGVGIIRSKLATSPVVSISPQEFAEKVGRNNYTYNSCLHSPILDNGSNSLHSNQTAVAWQIISLDFDDKIKITPQEVIDRLQDLLGLPNFIYATKRNPTHKCSIHDAQRFRVVYILDRPIGLDAYSRDRRRQYFNFLSGVFPSLDSATFDEARLFFGGETIIFEQYESFLNNELLQAVCDTNHIKVKSEKAFKKKLAGLAVEPKKDQENAKCNNIYIKNAVFKSPVVRWPPERWIEAEKSSPLLQKFFGAKEKILHPQLFMLYLVLMHIEGGVLKWRQAVKNNPTIDHIEKINKIHHWIQEKKKNEYVYEPPFKYVDPNVHNNIPIYLTQFGKNSQNCTTTLTSSYYVDEKDINIFRAELHTLIEEFFWSGGRILLKSPTGSSKSTTTMKLLNKNPKYRKGTVIAFPRHDLLDEFSEELTAHKIPHKRLFAIPQLNSHKLKNEIDILYRGGFSSIVRRIFKQIAKNNKAYIKKYDAFSDVDAIKAFYENNALLKKYDGLRLITHKALIFNDFKNVKKVIIDENPIDSLISTYDIDYNEFCSLITNSDGLLDDFNDILKNLIALYPDSKRLYKIKLNSFQNLNKNQIAKIEFPNLGLLLQCDFVYPLYKDGLINRLIFGQAVKLNKYPDVLLLSATASHKSLSPLISNLTFKNLGDVKLKGRLIQFVSWGYSKSTVSKLLYNKEFCDFLDQLLDKIGNTVIISHSVNELRERLKTKFNFHNTSGLNYLSSFDLIILGTEYPPDYLIPVRASLLGIPFSNTVMDFYRINRYGVDFTLRTYEDLTLRELHLDYIEELLMQSVGRARLAINKSRKVVVLAKVPLKQAELRLEKNYDKLLNEIVSYDVTGSNVPELGLIEKQEKDESENITYSKEFLDDIFKDI